MSERFRLDQSDIHSALWSRLKEHFEKELNKLRVQNEGDLDEIRTANLRGRIAQIKILLALDKPAPNKAADDV